MSQQTINVGSAPNDGNGDKLRDAMIKVNDNFTEVYGNFGNYQTTAGLSANVAKLSANNASYLGSRIATEYLNIDTISGNVATLAANSAAYIVANTGLVSNATGVFINVSYIATLTTNNALYLDGTSAAGYQTTAGLSGNVATLTANNTSYVGSVSAANVVSNTQLSSNLANYQTTAGLSGNVATLTANNTSYVGSVSAANVVSNTQLSSNLANYQTTVGLSANVATLTSNNSNYLGGAAAASYVNTSGAFTLSGVQTYSANVIINSNVTIGTAAGLNANGTIGSAGQYLTSNGTTVYWSTPGAVSVNVAAQYTWTNTQTFSNTITFNSTINGTANNTAYVGTVTAANVVSNTQLSSNLANYQTTAGLSANVAALAANSTTYLGSSGNFGNSSGIYTSGVVNAASYSVGTSFVANSTAVYDTAGNLRSTPINSQSGAYVLASSDNGKTVSITTGGVTVNGALLSTGQMFGIFNNSGSSQTITSGAGVTMYLGGTATTGNRTLAQYGYATAIMVAANTFVISGAGLT